MHSMFTEKIGVVPQIRVCLTWIIFRGGFASSLTASWPNKPLLPQVTPDLPAAPFEPLSKTRTPPIPLPPWPTLLKYLLASTFPPPKTSSFSCFLPGSCLEMSAFSVSSDSEPEEKFKQQCEDVITWLKIGEVIWSVRTLHIMSRESLHKVLLKHLSSWPDFRFQHLQICSQFFYRSRLFCFRSFPCMINIDNMEPFSFTDQALHLIIVAQSRPVTSPSSHWIFLHPDLSFPIIRPQRWKFLKHDGFCLGTIVVNGLPKDHCCRYDWYQWSQCFLGLCNHWTRWFYDGFWTGSHWTQWFFSGSY